MTHHELCLLAAQWLQSKNKLWSEPRCKYVVVEMVCLGSPCHPDVFGWGDGTGRGHAGVQIEAKMSHNDFKRDEKKKQKLNPQFDLGAMKYYCCPNGIIKPEELPQDIGLLYEIDGKIEVIKEANHRQDKTPSYEVPFIDSVMRRLKIKPQIFDFRKHNGEH